jgi:hypothetical protein
MWKYCENREEIAEEIGNPQCCHIEQLVYMDEVLEDYFEKVSRLSTFHLEPGFEGIFVGFGAEVCRVGSGVSLWPLFCDRFWHCLRISTTSSVRRSMASLFRSLLSRTLERVNFGIEEGVLHSKFVFGVWYST